MLRNPQVDLEDESMQLLKKKNKQREENLLVNNEKLRLHEAKASSLRVHLHLNFQAEVDSMESCQESTKGGTINWYKST